MKQSRSRLFNLLGFSCLLLAASNGHSAEPLALQKIMKDLGKNMQVITDAISREDWQRVEKTAPLIGDHPTPPFGEKLRILGFVGANMNKYKDYDGETQEHAVAVGKAANARNGQGVIFAFQKLQTSCYNCHYEFRKPFVEHFYGKQDAIQ